ncbi:histidine kinase [Leifsonia sp. YIM 134122]|uniref:histidine kinase n=1 Tax=Leifsonia stereocauli TaxID=3134136 RepID=A0ABU9W8L8_9MICO
MTSPIRVLWEAPAASPAPPRRVWRDWALVAVLPPLALVEAALRPDVPGRWLWAALLVALVPTLLWRRTHPLGMLATAFAAGTAMSLVMGGEPELFTTAYFLVLVYAVMRWGTGRAALAASVILAIGILSPLLFGAPTVADVIGSIAVVVTTSTLGVTFRLRASARARDLERMRSFEREQLARDLHDTVAHHVSAIAIQAQAGIAVAATDPEAATGVLRVIENEASRTLDEMRSMVRILRQDDVAELAPVAGLGELARLAQLGEEGPDVVVTITGSIDDVPPAISAAGFRIVQEAVTNARRHAVGATRVEVTVLVDDAGVRLDVHDDGEPVGPSVPGYGMAGMAERAALVGGTCRAGAVAGGGWTVGAVLPRSGWSV